MSVYNLSPPPFVRSALLPHILSLMRDTAPALRSSRQRFRPAVPPVRRLRYLGMLGFRISRMIALPSVRSVVQRGSGSS
jgi:hypothetical protein